jgi:hypothetical protein
MPLNQDMMVTPSDTETTFRLIQFLKLRLMSSVPSARCSPTFQRSGSQEEQIKRGRSMLETNMQEYEYINIKKEVSLPHPVYQMSFVK